MKILVTGGAGFAPNNSFLQNGLRPVIAEASYSGRAVLEILSFNESEVL